MSAGGQPNNGHSRNLPAAARASLTPPGGPGRRSEPIAQTARGVRGFTLLLSPDAVDYTQPVIVVVNGKEVYRGLPAKDVHTLLKWAVRDNDRTMLYATELPVAVH